MPLYISLVNPYLHFVPDTLTSFAVPEFVEEVMRLVELNPPRRALVGLPGSSKFINRAKKAVNHSSGACGKSIKRFFCVAGKFTLYIMFMFLTFMYFTFFSMMAVGLTPSLHLATVISSAVYSLWNLLSGFFVPRPRFEGSVKEYLEVHLDFGPGIIGASAAALIGLNILFFLGFAVSVKVLNFQRR
ncbi:hypothetical protein TIFTF001_000222 [Ficus carica]|uniref:ABC-2 type transporter transmembrane domain-containing protein n=1 Tax=Ficus carica TaxID=3494 RepID=A0AA87YWN8_FICCA|nr:hypothetical protein TIFTF001_000222 [Ficus carica]